MRRVPGGEGEVDGFGEGDGGEVDVAELYMTWWDEC